MNVVAMTKCWSSEVVKFAFSLQKYGIFSYIFAFIFHSQIIGFLDSLCGRKSMDLKVQNMEK